MKVAIAFPPQRQEKGRSRDRIQIEHQADADSYPMVAASAATLLKAKGYEVAWIDASTEGWSYRKFISVIKRERPDIVAMQATTALVKRHWGVIDDIKANFADNRYVTTVLMGDHVTALPEESLRNSKVDFVLTGGDFDFLLLNLCSRLGYDNPEPSLGLEPGIWYRREGEIRNSGNFKLNHDLNRLPLIDRELTKWWLYGRKTSKSSRPVSYTMVARDSDWGQSSLGSAAVLYPEKRYRTRSPENLLNEVGLMVEKNKVGEIFDLSGTFPSGSWLRSFCQGMISRGYNHRVRLGCWTRLGALTREDWQMMREAGFKKIFFRLESANDKTLKLLDKNLKNRQLFENVRCAKRAGLEPHLSVMIGFPWETAGEINKTVEFARRFLVDGWADGLEGKIVTPHPGTKFFSQCQQHGWLRSEDWNLYDDKQVLVKMSLDDETVFQIADNLGRQPLSPIFFLRKIASLSWLRKLGETANFERVIGYIKEILRLDERDSMTEQAEDDSDKGRKSRYGRV